MAVSFGEALPREAERAGHDIWNALLALTGAPRVDVYEIEPTLASRWMGMFVRAREKAPKTGKAELRNG